MQIVVFLLHIWSEWVSIDKVAKGISCSGSAHVQRACQEWSLGLFPGSATAVHV